MSGEKHVYRKRFEHAFEADETAKGFARIGNIDKAGPADVRVRKEDGSFFVYVVLEGDVDPHDVFEATGYERFI